MHIFYFHSSFFALHQYVQLLPFDKKIIFFYNFENIIHLALQPINSPFYLRVKNSKLEKNVSSGHGGRTEY